MNWCVLATTDGFSDGGTKFGSHFIFDNSGLIHVVQVGKRFLLLFSETCCYCKRFEQTAPRWKARWETDAGAEKY